MGGLGETPTGRVAENPSSLGNVLVLPGLSPRHREGVTTKGPKWRGVGTVEAQRARSETAGVLNTRGKCGRCKVLCEAAPSSRGPGGAWVGVAWVAQGIATRSQQLLLIATDPAGDLPD